MNGRRMWIPETCRYPMLMLGVLPICHQRSLHICLMSTSSRQAHSWSVLGPNFYDERERSRSQSKGKQSCI